MNTATQSNMTSPAVKSELTKKLKALGFKGFKICTQGHNLTVMLTDATPAQIKEVDAMADAYVYGYFDGMDDCYHYNPNRGPEAIFKYSQVENKFSAEMVEKARAFCKHHFGVENDEQAREFGNRGDYWDFDTFARCVLGGYRGMGGSTQEYLQAYLKDGEAGTAELFKKKQAEQEQSLSQWIACR